MTNRQAKCEERIDEHLESRLEHFGKFFELMREGEEPESEEIGNLYDYGLCFDYVPADTFNDQDQGYWRYQLSTGGPGDEFRFYGDREGNIHKVEYWFLDWFDGASRDVTDNKTIQELTEWFHGGMMFEHAYEKAMER